MCVSVTWSRHVNRCRPLAPSLFAELFRFVLVCSWSIAFGFFGINRDVNRLHVRDQRASFHRYRTVDRLQSGRQMDYALSRRHCVIVHIYRLMNCHHVIVDANRDRRALKDEQAKRLLHNRVVIVWLMSWMHCAFHSHRDSDPRCQEYGKHLRPHAYTGIIDRVGLP